MFLFRKIGSVLRGKATPMQVMFATVIGGMLGFVPGFFLPGDLGGGLMQAPGLMLSLLCLVLILNANLAVFGLCTLVGKLLSVALLSVSYGLGTWLLEGPLQGLFHGLVNGPVTAWFGLEYYATSGGLVLGLVFGVTAGVLMNRSIRLVRERMAVAEENSAAYQKYAQKRWVRFLAWALMGPGKGKQSWKELAESQKRGSPIRLLGLLFAAVLVGSVYVFQQWFSEPILTRNLKAGLEAVNGATVDLKSAKIGLGDGQLRLAGLAITDKQELGKDLLAADEVVATVDTGALLRKRFVIDEIKASSARGGTKRTTPGIVIPSTEPEPEPPPPPPAGTPTIDDYLKDYEVWKQRLAQAQEWIEAICGGDEPPPAGTPEQQQQQQQEQRQQQEALGLARVVAKHLLSDAPRVLVKKVTIEGISYSFGDRTEIVDLRAENLSDAPSKVAGALSFVVQSKSDWLKLGLAGKTATSPMGFDFALKRVPVDSVFGQLKLGGSAPLRGGTMDLAMKGAFTGGGKQALAMDVPLQVALTDTTFALAGSKETKVSSLLLPIGLRGALTSPSVSLDDKVLQEALVKAGQAELANFVQGQAGKLLGGYGASLNGIVDPSKSVGENVDAAKAKAEAEAKRIADEVKAKAEAEKKRLEEEAKKKLEQEAKKRLQGLIPGGGK
ncbi:MAG: hypothetical protein ACK501_13745 [Planctomycetota bacterium]|jgi:uncharacterized protein (TIGR03546 family)